MDLISVVVPFLNAGKYLQQCIDSVLSQTYQNIELILVDGGSTDDSMTTAELAHQKDQRVKVLTMSHASEAQALNMGLSAASGDYVFFMSGLDWLGGNDNLKELLNLLKDEAADVSLANFFEYQDPSGETLIHSLDGSKHAYSAKEWFQFEYQGVNFMDQCFSCLYGKLFKHQLLEMADFVNDSGNVHDTNTWKFYLLADKIAYVNNSMYVARRKAKSSSYHFDQEKLTALAAIEERIAILTIIGFDVSAELTEYVRRLNYQRDHALADGDYYNYLNAVNKLEIINKQKSAN